MPRLKHVYRLTSLRSDALTNRANCSPSVSGSRASGKLQFRHLSCLKSTGYFGQVESLGNVSAAVTVQTGAYVIRIAFSLHAMPGSSL